MAFSFSLNGIRSDLYGINVTNVKRTVLPSIKTETVEVANRRGLIYYKSNYSESYIKIDITLNSSTLELHRSDIRDIANFIKPDDGLKQLILDDEPNIYYWAVLTESTELDQIRHYSKGTLRFMIPDSYAYSINSENINYVRNDASFTRATNAYVDGVLYSNNVARYSTSKYTKGVLVEVGTTNLFTANQSSVETDTTGFTAVGSTISKNYFWAVNGKASLRVKTNRDAAYEGVEIGNVSIGGAFGTTFSTYIKGSGTVILRLYELNSGGSELRHTDSASIVLSNTVVIKSVSVTTGADCVNAKCAVITNSQQTADFYIDCLQIEKRAYRTSWQMGAVARNDEDLYIVSTNVFNGKEGTIEILFKRLAGVSTSGAIFERGSYSSPITLDRMILLHGTGFTNGLRRFIFRISRGASAETLDLSIDMDEASVEDNYYYIACRWYLAGNIKLDIYDFTNNKTYSANSSTTIASLAFTSYPNLVLGTNLTGGDYFANILIDDLRISNSERLDSEITTSIATIKENPLPLDSKTTYKSSWDNTLVNSCLTRSGSAASRIILNAVFTTTASELKIEKLSGEYVRIVKSFVAGDILIINFDTKEITVNGVNAKSYLDINSIFFYLNSGDNILKITPDGVTDTAISYIPRWL